MLNSSALVEGSRENPVQTYKGQHHCTLVTSYSILGPSGSSSSSLSIIIITDHLMYTTINCQWPSFSATCHCPCMEWTTTPYHICTVLVSFLVVLRLIFSVDFSRASVKWLVMSLSDTLVATGTYLLLTWISSLASFSNPRVVCLLALRPNGTIIFRCSRQRRSCARLTAHTHISHIIQPQYTYIHIYSGCGESSHHNIWQFSRQ